MPPILKPVEPFHKSEDGLVRVFCGDSTQIAPKLGKYDFVFADPPFNIGQSYAAYDDNMEAEDFRAFVAATVGTCLSAARPGGVVAFHGPDLLCELYLVACAMLPIRRIAWINWHYRFGQCGRGNWIDARCHCLLYVRDGGEYTWNPEAVLVESDRVGYGDKRVLETENGGKRLPGTVWGVPSDGPYWGRVQGNSAERRSGHPNQLPEVYLERLLRAYTNPGDRVLDPFAGSGTTAVVARALGRRCDTIDISLENCGSVVQRLSMGAVRVEKFNS